MCVYVYRHACSRRPEYYEAEDAATFDAKMFCLKYHTNLRTNFLKQGSWRKRLDFLLTRYDNPEFSWATMCFVIYQIYVVAYLTQSDTVQSTAKYN